MMYSDGSISPVDDGLMREKVKKSAQKARPKIKTTAIPEKESAQLSQISSVPKINHVSNNSKKNKKDKQKTPSIEKVKEKSFFFSTSFANSYLNISIITANCVQIKLIVGQNESKMCGDVSCPWPDKDKALLAFIAASIILQMVHSLVIWIRIGFNKLMCISCMLCRCCKRKNSTKSCCLSCCKGSTSVDPEEAQPGPSNRKQTNLVNQSNELSEQDKSKLNRNFHRAIEILNIMGIFIALIGTIFNMIINAFFFDLDLKYPNTTMNG